MRRLLLIAVSSSVLIAQGQTKPTPTTIVPDNRLHAMMVAVVPMVGTGKPDDLIRPMFTPSPKDLMSMSPRKDGRPAGIFPSHFQLSDDGKSAIVEFVEADRATLAPILKSTDPRVKAFERGVNSKTAIEAEFKKVKAGFTLESLSPARMAPPRVTTLTPVRIAQ